MPVISTSDPNYNTQKIEPFDYYFTDVSFIEIPASVHGKKRIFHVQAYEDLQLIYPSINISSDLTVTIDMTILISGKIRIF